MHKSAFTGRFSRLQTVGEHVTQPDKSLSPHSPQRQPYIAPRPNVQQFSFNPAQIARPPARHAQAPGPFQAPGPSQAPGPIQATGHAHGGGPHFGQNAFHAQQDLSQQPSGLSTLPQTTRTRQNNSYRNQSPIGQQSVQHTSTKSMYHTEVNPYGNTSDSSPKNHTLSSTHKPDMNQTILLLIKYEKDIHTKHESILILTKQRISEYLTEHKSRVEYFENEIKTMMTENQKLTQTINHQNTVYNALELSNQQHPRQDTENPIELQTAKNNETELQDLQMEIKSLNTDIQTLKHLYEEEEKKLEQVKEKCALTKRNLDKSKTEYNSLKQKHITNIEAQKNYENESHANIKKLNEETNVLLTELKSCTDSIHPSQKPRDEKHELLHL
jgi:hypothetical protein